MYDVVYKLNVKIKLYIQSLYYNFIIIGYAKRLGVR